MSYKSETLAKIKFPTRASATYARYKEVIAPPSGHVPEYELCRRLDTWIDEMYEWGVQVKKDIQKLEKACGIKTPDPGDPPPKPWG